MARNIAAIARALPAAGTVANPTGAFGGSPVATGPGGPTSPLVASYAEWSAGRVNAALPRDPRVFLDGTFGPLSPMWPQPIDQPPTGGERPEPRRFTYPSSWNMPHGVPGDEGLNVASFATLRTIANSYSVARACINLRIQEILAIEWDVVPSKDAEKKMRGDREARREFDERRAPVKKFFYRPDPGKFHGFESWLTAVLEEVFVVDALSLYLQPSRTRGKGRGIPGSNLGALCLISGDIVRPMLDLRGGIPQPPNVAYQIVQYGVPRVDLMTALYGDIPGADAKGGRDEFEGYRADQMLYLPYYPRSWTPYGYPPIAQAMLPIMSGIQRQQYQYQFYSEGSIPGLFVSPGDMTMTPNQCRELQDALNAMAGDPAWKHRIIVLPPGSKTDPQRPGELAGPFDELLLTQTAMAFGVMPTELGVSTHGTRNAMGAASNVAKANADINERKALKPLLKWLKSTIFDYILREVLDQPDMQWHWEGLEEGEDEAATVDVLVNEMTHGLVSIDEARVIRGHQPWGIPMTSEPVYFTATGITPLGSIDMSTGAPVGAPPTNAMQAAAGVVPGAPPAFGGPPGGPGKPGEDGGKPKPKPKGPGPNGPKGPGGGAPTPAHAGAQAAVASQPTPGHGAQMLPANPKPLPKPVLAHQDPDSPLDRKPINKALGAVASRHVQRALLAKEANLTEAEFDTAYATGDPVTVVGALAGGFYEDDEPVEQVKAAFSGGRHFITTVDVPAALRELDLIGHRLTKGAGLNGWVNRHLPADVFDTLHTDGDVAKARTAVEDAGQRQRRDTALAATQQQVINGLHDLAAAIGDGSLSTPGFIDAAVALLRSSIHEGLRLGTGHALVDAGRATQRTAWATKQAGDGPGWVDGLDGRFGLYAGTIPQAYELGYGLATIGAHDNPDNLVIEWHARPDACDMCDTWSTMLHTADTLPGMPGQGGFGADATVCEGGPRCRCRLAYRLASPAEVEAIQLRHADTTPTPEQLAAADQRARDAQAIRRALDDDDPNAALALVLADLADERAEAQRGWLMGLLKDILTAATRGANALRTWLVTKAFDPAEPRDEHGQWTLLGALIHDLNNLSDHDTERHFGRIVHSATVGGDSHRITAHDTGKVLISVPEAGGTHTPVAHLDAEGARTLAADLDRMATDSLHDATEPGDPGFEDWAHSDLLDDTTRVADQQAPYAGYDLLKDVHLVVPGAGQDGADWHAEMSTNDAWATERALETAADAADDAAEQLKEARENADWDARQAQLEAQWAQAHAADVLPESDVSATEVSGGASRNFDVALMSDGSIGLSDTSEFEARMTRDRAAALAALIEEMRNDPVPADADPTDWYDGDFVGGDDSPVQLNRRGDGSMQVTVETAGDEFEYEIDEDEAGQAAQELRRLLALPVTKTLTKAADPAAAVVAQMRENYPPKALGWMKSAQWAAPTDVPLDDIDFDDIDRWAASHDKARVKHFARQLRKGRDVKPVVAVQEPGGDKIKVIDGHHRTLAARKNGQPVRAYVGTVDANGGPWDETHVWQVHDGADTANKVAGVDLGKGRLPPGPRDWKEHPWSHGWVWHGPTAVGTTIDHKSFGKGRITGATKTRIKVMFPDGKERTFPHAAGIAPDKTHGAGRHRAPQAAKDGKKKLAKDLLDDVSNANGKEVTDPAALDAARGVFEGVHGGLSVKLKKLAADDGYFEADLSIHDHTGQQIGRVVRTIGRDEDGNLFATHVLLKVSSDTRGQGFAQSFNRQLEDWYRESGIQRIELRADIDVGGYAWARSGYTWQDGKVPSSIRDRLVQAIAPHRSHDYHVDFDKDGNYTVTTNGGESLGSYEFYDDVHTAIGMHALDSSPNTSERREAKALLARIGAGEHVTPFEISQLGRPAGAGRDDTWPGKLALLGSDWEGVKWL